MVFGPKKLKKEPLEPLSSELYLTSPEQLGFGFRVRGLGVIGNPASDSR